MDNLKGKKIFVGLSGGVDSAVTAALLQKAGADVYGVFIKGWFPEGLPCTWASDRRDAMRVAAALHIPFHTLDASVEYKQSVIDYLIREYGEGRTPNPDIMCNRDVKFGIFYRFAKEHGADFIATGHYAQTKDGMLARGVDPDKDQSYFLWAVPKEALAMTLFPLGGMHKADVRTLARSFNLPNAQKRDSQGICFLGPVSMEDFLRAEFGVETGSAVTVDGTLVGSHSGALLHTLGERIALTDAPPGPWYVLQKDLATNTLVVSRERLVTTEVQDLTLAETNWLQDVSPDEVLHAQFRYHGPVLEGKLIEKKVFQPSGPIEEPLASGQSLVVYRDQEVIGGGIIS